MTDNGDAVGGLDEPRRAGGGRPFCPEEERNKVRTMIHRCPSCGAKNRIPASRLDQTARCGRCKTPLTPLDRPYAISSEAEFDELINESPLPVLVDFWADWCAPCRMVAPEVEKLARSEAGRLVAAKVDTEALPMLAARYGIQGIPTLLLFRNGRVAGRVTGAQPAHALAAQLGL